ncbi:DUF2933 domain-containing protein [Streptomyces sp. SAI-090]|uniref:DUF2933 domain-containing protein n=1 Tax=Streptomyces sp. SAI-090 TaxID=2940545 RepID=UPI0024762C0F|nr:DUF2933 domain-containing protein [Streptomyces sp. SAI-090]MDH6522319.1 hypothetical protein [Streptomyces sp. SAI-090]
MNHLNKKVLIAAGVVAAGLFLLGPARAVAALPLLLLALCPLSMMFMMRGTHGHGGATHASGTAAQPEADKRIADLEEEVRILRAASVQRRTADRTPPFPVDLDKPDEPGPHP